MSEWRLPEEGAYDECGAVRSGRFFDAQQIRQVQWSTVERAREPEIRDLPQESAWVLSQPDEQRFWPRLQTTCLFYCNKYVGSTTDLCCIRHAQLNVNTFFFRIWDLYIQFWDVDPVFMLILRITIIFTFIFTIFTVLRNITVS